MRSAPDVHADIASVVAAEGIDEEWVVAVVDTLVVVAPVFGAF